VTSFDSTDRDSGLVYAEDRCALRWPLVCFGLLGCVGGAALAVVCFWLGVTTTWQRGFAALSAAGIAVSCFWTLQLWSNWPTGIRVDTAGIQIGGVGRKPDAVTGHSVLGQRHEVFSCPWTAVRGIAVTDRAGLRGLRAQLAERQPSAHARHHPDRPGDTEMRPRTAGVRLGWMPAPFMRAALVIYVEPDNAHFPLLLPWRSYGRTAMRKVGTPSRVWLAPTRHPDALRAALARVPGCPPVTPWAAPDDEGSPARPA
jgi:hypothetical protein